MGKFKKEKIVRKGDLELENDGAYALMAPEAPKTISISNKSIIVASSIVLILVIVAAVLAYTLPTGVYDTITIDGKVQIDPNGEFHLKELPRLAWWKLILSPVMILNPQAEGAILVWAILALLFVIGAIFTALDKTGILVYMIHSLKHRFQNKRYTLLFIMPLIFMFLGTSAGMFEEIVPVAPIVILLSYAFGWDALVGLGMSILAACFGCSAGIVNPFNVGVAQSLLGLPVFSGAEIRVLTFVVGYIVLMAFLFAYVKKIEKNPQKSLVYKEDLEKKKGYNIDETEFVRDPNKDKALKWFGAWLIVIVAIAIISIFIQPRFIPALGTFSLADYVLYITVLIYIIAGIGACIMCGQKGKELCKNLLKGMLTLVPAIAMILFAGGIRYIMEEGNVMDTLIYYIVKVCEGKDPAVIILLIYVAIFIMEMFIPSGSAKAFLLMPLIGAICIKVGINQQIAVLLLAYADGFSNMILPTNPALLLCLGMTTVSFPKWTRWSLKIQFVMLLCTLGILMMCHYCNIFG